MIDDRLALAVALAAILVVYSQPLELTCDDAYITFRYAENLSGGLGFVFNPGERVYGLTTPLYGLLLGGLHKAGIPLASASRLVGMAAACGAVLALRKAGEKIFDSAAAGTFAAIFLFSIPSAAAIGLFGMETVLFVALLALGFWLLEDHPWLAIVVLGVSLGVRIEAVTALAAAALYAMAKSDGWKSRLGKGALAAALGLLYLGLGQAYYGMPLPASVVQKVGSESSAGGALTLLRFFGSMLFGVYPRWSPAVNPGMALPVLAAAGLIGAARRRNARVLPLLGFAAAYMAAYVLSGKAYAAVFVWYFVPPLVAVALPAGAGLVRAAPALPEAVRSRYAAAAFAVLWAALAAWPIKATLEATARNRHNRVQEYAAAALWLRGNSPADTVVAAHEIGTLAFFSERYVLDTFGLVSKQSWGKTAVEVVLEERPEYIVYKDHYPDIKEIEGIKRAVSDDYEWLRWRTLWIGARKGVELPAPKVLDGIFVEERRR